MQASPKQYFGEVYKYLDEKCTGATGQHENGETMLLVDLVPEQIQTMVKHAELTIIKQQLRWILSASLIWGALSDANLGPILASFILKNVFGMLGTDLGDGETHDKIKPKDARCWLPPILTKNFSS